MIRPRAMGTDQNAVHAVSITRISIGLIIGTLFYAVSIFIENAIGMYCDLNNVNTTDPIGRMLNLYTVNGSASVHGREPTVQKLLCGRIGAALAN